jgi:hypothetical protein
MINNKIEIFDRDYDNHYNITYSEVDVETIVSTNIKKDIEHNKHKVEIGDKESVGTIFIPSYAIVYTNANQTIPFGGKVFFTNISMMDGFTLFDKNTLQVDVSGIYWEIKTINALEPNSFALYINDVLYPTTLFGSKSVAQDIGDSIIVLKSGDKLQLKNQNYKGEEISLSSLDSFTNDKTGQITPVLSIFRIA